MPEPLDQQFSKTYLYRLHSLTNTLDKAFDTILHIHASLTLPQFMLLIAVSEHRAINQRQAAQFLGLSAVAIKRQTDIAIDNQWLKREKTAILPGHTLSLTPKGQTAIQNGLQALEQHLFKVFSDSSRHADLMTHLDVLHNHTKGVIDEQLILRQRKK